MKRRVVVTGMGAVTSLGCRVEECGPACATATAASDPLQRFDASAYRVRFGGEVLDAEWSTEGYIDPKDAKRLDRFTQFAMVAGIDAVRDSGIDFSREDPFRCGVMVGSGIGGLHEIEVQHTRLAGKGTGKSLRLHHSQADRQRGQRATLHRVRPAGPNAAVVTACASATNAIGDAFRTIQYDDADVMITGGSEAAVTPMGLSGFAAMRALSERNDAPAQASRPFDADRDGFVLSEGAGVLVLEELEHAKARGAKIYAEMLGYGISADGGHITQPDKSGAGAAHAMALAVRDARIDPSGNRLHQRPRHQHPAGRPGGDHGHQVRLQRARLQAERLQHQEPVGPSARRQRRRGTDLLRPGPPRRLHPADDQLQDPRPALRPGLHAQPGQAAEDHRGHVEQLRFRRPQRLAGGRRAAERACKGCGLGT